MSQVLFVLAIVAFCAAWGANLGAGIPGGSLAGDVLFVACAVLLGSSFIVEAIQKAGKAILAKLAEATAVQRSQKEALAEISESINPTDEAIEKHSHQLPEPGSSETCRTIPCPKCGETLTVHAGQSEVTCVCGKGFRIRLK
jgi:hypothetical protein